MNFVFDGENHSEVMLTVCQLQTVKKWRHWQWAMQKLHLNLTSIV